MNNPGKRVVSLFSGAGGLDLGLERAGLFVSHVVENWEPARRVLRERFPQASLHGDVRDFSEAEDPFLIAAGFPCVDVSHVGKKAGLKGARSGLVSHVFRIADQAPPEWILLENVSNLLSLGGGSAMRTLTKELENRGYRWAYRTVDSRFTGVPQRRSRVLILASRTGLPAQRLLRTTVEPKRANDRSIGFYWTEGRYGLGLVEGGIPTLKAGSTIGLNSAPAVIRSGIEGLEGVVTPTIESQEVLQGFPAGWTAVGGANSPGERARLVGNAVTVGVGTWLGEVLSEAAPLRHDLFQPMREIDRFKTWPAAGFGDVDGAYATDASAWPQHPDEQASISGILDEYGGIPLSERATRGFLGRVKASGRKVDGPLLLRLERHLNEWESRAFQASAGRETSGRGSSGKSLVARPPSEVLSLA